LEDYNYNFPEESVEDFYDKNQKEEIFQKKTKSLNEKIISMDKYNEQISQISNKNLDLDLVDPEEKLRMEEIIKARKILSSNKKHRPKSYKYNKDPDEMSDIDEEEKKKIKKAQFFQRKNIYKKFNKKK